MSGFSEKLVADSTTEKLGHSLEIAEEKLDPPSSSNFYGPKIHNPSFASSINIDEPVVTRKELWAYYCA